MKWQIFCLSMCWMLVSAVRADEGAHTSLLGYAYDSLTQKILPQRVVTGNFIDTELHGSQLQTLAYYWQQASLEKIEHEFIGSGHLTAAFSGANLDYLAEFEGDKLSLVYMTKVQHKAQAVYQLNHAVLVDEGLLKRSPEDIYRTLGDQCILEIEKSLSFFSFLRFNFSSGEQRARFMGEGQLTSNKLMAKLNAELTTHSSKQQESIQVELRVMQVGGESEKSLTLLDGAQFLVFAFNEQGIKQLQSYIEKVQNYAQIDLAKQVKLTSKLISRPVAHDYPTLSDGLLLASNIAHAVKIKKMTGYLQHRQHLKSAYLAILRHLKSIHLLENARQWRFVDESAKLELAELKYQLERDKARFLIEIAQFHNEPYDYALPAALASFDGAEPPLVTQLFSALDIRRLSLDSHDLLAAAQAGDLAKVTELLEFNAFNLDFADTTGRTALHYAAANRATDMVELCLEKGAKLMVQDAFGISPFDLVMRYDRKLAFRLLKYSKDYL